MTDTQLLADYCQSRSDEAFAALVKRYIRLVHCACWRQLRDVQLAEDATQQVFILLSRKAPKLRNGILAGWLLATAHYTCANMRRAEARRLKHQEAVAMSHASEPVEENSRLLELLDEGMLRLRPRDREALALRFLQNHPMSEVGKSLGVSEDAARKRVERGLEKLRRFFQSRGLEAHSIALAALLADSSNVPPVPESLTGRIIQASHAARYSSIFVLHTKAAVALFAVLLGSLTLAGWGIYSNVSRPPAATAISPTPVSNSAISASSPGGFSRDFSSPDATLATFGQALQSADSSLMSACVLPGEPVTPLRAGLDEELARQRILLAAVRRYGPGANVLVNNLGGDLMSVAVQQVVMLRRLAAATATVTGNSAVVNVPIPDAVLRSAPPGVRSALLQWSHTAVYFQFREHKWVIDLNRTVRCVMKVRDRNSDTWHDPGDEQAIAIIEAAADEYNRVAVGIETGKLPRLADAQRATDEVIGRVRDRFGLDDIHSTVVAANTDLTPTTNPEQQLQPEQQPPPAMTAFRVTSRSYSDKADLEAAVVGEFGDSYRVADWQDVLKFQNNISDWADSIGLKAGGGSKSLFVTFNQGRYFADSRQYFIARFDGNKPSTFLAHDSIGDDTVCLGSWYKIDRRILAIHK